MKSIGISIITVLVFLLTTAKSFALGIGEWENTTPGGNRIVHDQWSDTITLYLNYGFVHQIAGLSRWYFYKDHIIGEYNNGGKYYFIVDEDDGHVDTFHTRQEWQKYISDNSLNPSMWTRWYSWEWQISPDDKEMMLWVDVGLGLGIALPIALVIYSYKAPKNKNFRFRKLYFKTTLIAIGILIIFTVIGFILAAWPQSI